MNKFRVFMEIQTDGNEDVSTVWDEIQNLIEQSEKYKANLRIIYPLQHDNSVSAEVHKEMSELISPRLVWSR